jgi:hypothetical protein
MDPAILAFPPLIYCLGTNKRKEMMRNGKKPKGYIVGCLTSFQEGPKI